VFIEDPKMSKNSVFVGLFGSGKTEVAINFALKLRSAGRRVAIADIDIVSPYFRTRDARSLLEKRGLTVITPPKQLMKADLPIITASVAGYLSNASYDVVLDVGGEESGIVVLGYLEEHLKDADFYFVVNTRRPFTTDVEGIVSSIDRLRSHARIEIDFLVNNANTGDETTPKIVKEGEEILKEVSNLMKIPVAFSVVKKDLKVNDTAFPIFRIERFMTLDKEVER